MKRKNPSKTKPQIPKTYEDLAIRKMQPHIKLIEKYLSYKNGQFLLVGPDLDILELIIQEIIKKTNKACIFVKDEKDSKPNGKLFIINLKNINSLVYQSILYFYLELANKNNCHVCLISTSSLCLSYFEKRVRSRFENKIVFASYLDKNTCSHETHKTLRSLKNCEMRRKYNIQEYTLSSLFDLCDTIHYIILLISHFNKVKIDDFYSQFLIAVKDVVEIKKVSPSRVIYCLNDLISSGIINSQGKYAGDYDELKSFILKSGQEFLKRFMRQIESRHL